MHHQLTIDFKTDDKGITFPLPSIVNKSLTLINNEERPELLFITTYPPRECGIATYSQDLIKSLNNKFGQSIDISICSIESNTEMHTYQSEVKYILNTSQAGSLIKLAKAINANHNIQLVVVQHEFGLFHNKEEKFKQFLNAVIQPVILAFHTVLPSPNKLLKSQVQQFTRVCESVLVMTHNSASILINDYKIPKEKINVIPHGTHLVPHYEKTDLKNKYHFGGKRILSTFGLLSSGKNIETTLDALPAIIKVFPEVLFLIIGKTHPSVVTHEGEKYRKMLETKTVSNGLGDHVIFINEFLPLDSLLKYLQMTDIYLFTSKDPNQAVSGTFSYAISCGCPIISTPIPHALEILGEESGILIDFENSAQLSDAVIRLLENDALMQTISDSNIHKMAPTSWENAAIAHVRLFGKMSNTTIKLKFNIPDYNLDHFYKMTTATGIIQFSKINMPDIETGYTLDDNARALISMCQYYKIKREPGTLVYINLFYNFIRSCQQINGTFLNYVDKNRKFTCHNDDANLDDANGRALWALGYLISITDILPTDQKGLATDAEKIFKKGLIHFETVHSTRAMAFAIKGLYLYNQYTDSITRVLLIKKLANRILKMYEHESSQDWKWFESSITYGNSILPEAMLYAYITTDEKNFMSTAISSFEFLLSKTFTEKHMCVISNQTWLNKNNNYTQANSGGEQPIDVAYTIMTLDQFYRLTCNPDYLKKMQVAFDWFLGNNHLNRIMYNPCTGGCYDGLEENHVNLNQGAESTISYLMARLTIDHYLNTKKDNNKLYSQQSVEFSRMTSES